MALRIVFAGASSIARLAARRFVDAGHEVVIVEPDPERIEALQDELDCGFVEGEGSRPSVLEDIDMASTDFLFCLSDSDQDNILASLVAQSMDVGRVVTKIENPDYQVLCGRLGLEDTIVPDREIAESLMDIVSGREPALTAALEGDLRFFTFVAGEELARPIEALELPEDCRVVAVMRDERSILADDDTLLEENDRVLIVTREERLSELRERFPSRTRTRE